MFCICLVIFTIISSIQGDPTNDIQTALKILSDKFETFKHEQLSENRVLRNKVDSQRQMISMLHTCLSALTNNVKNLDDRAVSLGKTNEKQDRIIADMKYLLTSNAAAIKGNTNSLGAVKKAVEAVQEKEAEVTKLVEKNEGEIRALRNTSHHDEDIRQKIHKTMEDVKSLKKDIHYIQSNSTETMEEVKSLKKDIHYIQSNSTEIEEAVEDIKRHDLPDLRVRLHKDEEAVMKISQHSDELDEAVDNLQIKSNETQAKIETLEYQERETESAIIDLQSNSTIAKDRIDKLEIRNQEGERRIEKLRRNITDLQKESDEKLLQLDRRYNRTLKHVEENTNTLNGTLLQLKMLNQYNNGYKKKLHNMSFEDIVWLSHVHDYGVTHDSVILQRVEKEFIEFEDMWGPGSMKGAIAAIAKLDEEKRKAAYTSLRDIKKKDRIKFVESPSNSTKIHGEFSRDEGGDIIVQGFINVKDEEFGWLPIYPWKRLDEQHFHAFGYIESVVTCREGGYNSGSFVTTERNNGTRKMRRIFFETVCKRIGDHLQDCDSGIFMRNDYRINVEIKCSL